MADTKLFSSQMSNPLPGNARLTLKKSDGSEIGSYEPLGEDKELTLPTGSDNVFFATYGTTTLREVLDAIAADKLVIARDLSNAQYTIFEVSEVRAVFESVQRRQQITASITYERLVLVDDPVAGGGWSYESQELAKKSDLIVHHDATLDGDGTEANPLKVSELAVPTKTSDLTNDSGFITEATFVATYDSTTFADIKQAITDGKCVKCDVSGYTYELVQSLSDKITFALTNNVNGTIAQETIWVTSDNEWDGEAVNLAKTSDVPSKTSDLTNDAGFAKLVVSDTAPAEGTPDDVVTVILGNAAGGGDYGAWELIGEGTDIAADTQIDLSRGIKEFDFVILQAFGLFRSNNYNGSCIYNTGTISYGSTDIYCGSDFGNGVRICFLSSTQIKITEVYGAFRSFKLYGINLRGKENVYSTEEQAIGKWIDGSTIYRKVILSPVLVGGREWTTILTESSIKNVLKADVISSYNGADQLYCAPMWCRVYMGHIQVNGLSLSDAKIGDPITIEYTKNEG